MIIQEMKSMRDDIAVLIEETDENSWQRELLSSALAAIDLKIERVINEMRRLEAPKSSREYH